MAGQDDRGVSTLVGAILLFGMILVVYATWQAAVVPAENKQIEFNSFQEAGEDVIELQNALYSTGMTGVRSDVVVHTGTRYPARVMFVNPPPATGTLTTEFAGDVVFRNVSAADGDVQDYWSGTVSLDTSRVTFRPDYNVLRASPLGVDPSGAVYLNGSGGTVVRDAQTLVHGERISLVTVAGDYREGGVTVSPSVQPVSTGAETISVTNNDTDRPLTVTLPTRLDQPAWTEVAENQNSVTTADVSGNTVTVTFQEGTYFRLHLARVAVSESSGASDQGETNAAYLTAADSTLVTDTSSSIPLRAVVNDKYTHGVSGTDVTFDIVSDKNGNLAQARAGSCSAVSSGTDTATATSQPTGEAGVCFVPQESGSFTIDTTIRGRSDSANRTTFTVTVVKS